MRYLLRTAELLLVLYVAVSSVQVHRALASVSPNNPMAREEAERKVERLLAGSMSRKGTSAASTRTPRRDGRLASAISTAVAEAVHRAEESKTPYIDARIRRSSQPRASPTGRLSTGGPSSMRPTGAAVGETGEHLGHSVARNLAAELSGAAPPADQSMEQSDPRPTAASAPSPSLASPPASGPGPRHESQPQSHPRGGAITRSAAKTHSSQHHRLTPTASTRAPLSPYASEAKAGSQQSRAVLGTGAVSTSRREAQQCDAPEEQGASEGHESGVTKPLSPAQLRERFRRSPDACLLAVVQAVARKAARDRGEPLPSKESSAFSPLGTPAFIRRRKYEEAKLLMEAGDEGVDREAGALEGAHATASDADHGHGGSDEREKLFLLACSATLLSLDLGPIVKPRSV